MEEQISKQDSPDWVEIYRASRYAFAFQGKWRAFALDGDEPPMTDLDLPVTLITAWNPNSDERAQDWNEAANLRLGQSLHEAGFQIASAWGGSLPEIEPAWKEDGFAVMGWSREVAALWGRRWAQRALVYLDKETSQLIFCEDGRVVDCGLRRFPSP